jgi:hypothetical protein
VKSLKLDFHSFTSGTERYASKTLQSGFYIIFFVSIICFKEK